MITETNGLVLKNTRIARDRRMLVLLTRKFGKISAGTGISPRAKNRSQLPLGPFTYGRYELYKGRDTFNLNSADTIESFFEIGEDVDKYFAASFALEFTEAILPYEQPAEEILDALIQFLKILRGRSVKIKSLLLIYQWKVLALSGYMPNLYTCCKCGRDVEPAAISIADGGIICDACKNGDNVNISLLYYAKDDIILTLKFLERTDMERFAGLSLKADVEEQLQHILKDILSYHLNINELKSEAYLIK